MTERLLRYRENIAAACPELAMETAELFRAGQNNDLILVNGELIFRFPKYRQGIARLGRERAILNAVRGRLPLATPDYFYHNVDEEEVGRAFVGYRKLPGSSLWSEEYAQISDEGTIDRLATDVASFLQTLHATPLDSISMPLGPPDSQAGWQDMFSRIREVVYPHLTAEARRWTTERFAAFLEDDEHFAFSKVLRHGDFGHEQHSCTAPSSDGSSASSTSATPVLAILRSTLRGCTWFLRRTVPEALRTRLSANRSVLGTDPFLCRVRLLCWRMRCSVLSTGPRRRAMSFPWSMR